MNTHNREILQIALPSIVSNITVPLLGLIDTAIVGHLGAASYIGAIAVGGMLFNIIYWIFGFLRMGTSGMTSQAYGQKDEVETMRILARSIGVGMLIALGLIVLQYPIERIAFTTYFRICIWGAPAVLGLYSISGWCIGMQNSRFPMYVAITQNIVNILASLTLVYGFGMKIEGVAIGTLVAQYAGLLMATGLWTSHFKRLLTEIHLHSLIAKGAIRRFFQVNRDIFLRHHVLYLGRSETRQCSPGSQHLTDALLHFLFVHHGRICLCRRGTGRQAYRSKRPTCLTTNDPPTLHLGHCTGTGRYPYIRHRRQRVPQPYHQ